MFWHCIAAPPTTSDAVELLPFGAEDGGTTMDGALVSRLEQSATARLPSPRGVLRKFSHVEQAESPVIHIALRGRAAALCRALGFL